MSLDSVGEGLLRRHLGRQLTRLREAAGMSQEQAARAVDLSRSTIVRMEDGADGVRFKAGDVNVILDAYAADAKDRDLILTLTREIRAGREAEWWHAYDSGVPGWFGLYLMLEDSAASVFEYQAELIPGLLQTPEYTEQLLTHTVDLTDAQLQKHTEVRLKRQELLLRPDGPRLEYVIHESAIRRPFGPPATVATQLEHLTRLAADARILLRILPANVGMHSAMVTGPFSLLDFPLGPQDIPIEPRLAYVETTAGAIYVRESEKVATYEKAAAGLVREALSRDASLKLLASMRN